VTEVVKVLLGLVIVIAGVAGIGLMVYLIPTEYFGWAIISAVVLSLAYWIGDAIIGEHDDYDSHGA